MFVNVDSFDIIIHLEHENCIRVKIIIVSTIKHYHKIARVHYKETAFKAFHISYKLKSNQIAMLVHKLLSSNPSGICN